MGVRGEGGTKKNGGGGGARSNFPTRDHQNIFNLILTYIYRISKHLLLNLLHELANKRLCRA